VGPGERFLVWRMKRGDGDACRELIRRHHGSVYGYLRRLGADESLAEDLTQETYARAWSRIGTLRTSTSLRAWLLTIARNEFFQWVRTRRPETTGLEPVERRDDDPGVEHAMTRDEADLGLRRAVASLAAELQETVALHYFQELSLREVAAILGLPGGTVKSRLHRALRDLRGLLESEEAKDGRPRAREALARDS
jgi:RNA polymerase sigma-70 factor (ECF subfamily)